MANANATLNKPTHPIERSEFADIETFLRLLGDLLYQIPVYVDHADLIISAADGVGGPGRELGTVVVETSADENVSVHFHPYVG